MNNWDGIVSLFIACLEFVLLVNLLIFAKKTKLNWIIIAIVFLLLGYQTIEYLICGIGLSSSFMAYLAFVDISFLPPLNLLFVLTLLKKENKFVPVILLPALFFAVYYAFVVREFETVKCTVLYATYNYPLGDLYGFFYYSTLAASFILIVKNLRSEIGQAYKSQLKYLMFGHLSLLIPVTTAFILLAFNLSGLRDSIESILCKFAFLYCLSLVYFALSNKKSKV